MRSLFWHKKSYNTKRSFYLLICIIYNCVVGCFPHTCWVIHCHCNLSQTKNVRTFCIYASFLYYSIVFNWAPGIFCKSDKSFSFDNSFQSMCVWSSAVVFLPTNSWKHIFNPTFVFSLMVAIFSMVTESIGFFVFVSIVIFFVKIVFFFFVFIFFPVALVWRTPWTNRSGKMGNWDGRDNDRNNNTGNKNIYDCLWWWKLQILETFQK